jgi:hypothetical protein
MYNFRQRFTKWYYRKGYRMEYKPCSYGDGVAELIFLCPWWVRPLVWLFFSPCVYYREMGYNFGQAFTDGLTSAYSNVD